MQVMAVAYILHLIWMLLPAILLIPLILFIGLTLACRFLPNCITLSDYGILATNLVSLREHHARLT